MRIKEITLLGAVVLASLGLGTLPAWAGDINSDLLNAAARGDTAIVQALLDKGADVNAKNKYGITALMYTAMEGHTDTVQALLHRGADVNAKDKHGNTALILAAREGYTVIVQALLDRGVDVNAKDKYGNTALTATAFRSHTSIVQALLDNGADVNAKTNNGNTALMYAANLGHTTIVQALVDKGADVDDIVLRLATAKGHTLTAQILLDKVADGRAKEKSAGSQVAKLSSVNAVKIKPPLSKLTPSPKRQHEAVYTQIPGERWAVIIGISSYQDTRIPALRYASADAKSFYDWATSPEGGKYAPARVKLLIDQDATGRNIKDALFTWLKQVIKEDMITIYFAGHGSPDSPDSDNLFLLPYDTQYDNIAATGFPMWDIETALKRFIKAKKVVVIADACHAGGVGQAFDIARRADRGIEVNPISSGLQNLSRIGDGICVISASDDKQLSQEGKTWGGGHGVFTYFLLKGLKGKADYNQDSRVTLGELIPFLSEQVRRATRNAQSPIVAGRYDPALSIQK